MVSRGKHVARRPRRRQTRLFGRAVPLALAFVMVTALVAWADQVEADADALSTTVPQPNNVSANQQPGTTFAYDLSAHIKETGASSNKVFQQAGDSVLVTITRSGAWLSSTPDAGTPASFTFTAYEVNEAGTISVTVPCGTEAGTVEVMSAVLTGTPTRGQLNPATRTLTYSITAQGADHASCAPTNSQPHVAADGASVTVDEGSLAEMTGTWSDADADDNVTLDASVGTVVKAVTGPDNSGTWSWSHMPDDGPSDSQIVTITANDNTGTANATNTATFQLNVINVAPAASASASSLNALSGVALSFSFSATDPSNTDTLAGFDWRFNDGQGSGFGSFALVTPTGVSPATLFKPSATYAACGSYTATAQARDKDLGESNQPTVAVSVFDGDWHGAIKPAVRNQVQAGRVIPVQIRLGCEGVPLTGLTPGIRLLTGDQDPDTTAFDEAVTTTTSVSSADTTGFMRETSDGYIYNLQIPKSAKAGDMFTIAVRPWGSDGPQLRAVVEIRK